MYQHWFSICWGVIKLLLYVTPAGAISQIMPSETKYSRWRGTDLATVHRMRRTKNIQVFKILKDYEIYSIHVHVRWWSIHFNLFVQYSYIFLWKYWLNRDGHQHQRKEQPPQTMHSHFMLWSYEINYKQICSYKGQTVFSYYGYLKIISTSKNTKPTRIKDIVLIFCNCYLPFSAW